MRVLCCAFALAVAFALAPGAARADQTDTEKGLALFEEGVVHYRNGRFDDAIRLFQAAYDLAHEPILLFNVAKAYEGKGDLDAAVKYYERYLAEAKDIEDRGAIEARLEALRAQLEARRVLERKAEDERKRADRAEKQRRPSPIPWIFAGVGVTGLVVGGALGGFAKAKEDEANAALVQLDAAALRDDAEPLALGANVAFVVGGAILAGATTWGIVDVVLSTRTKGQISAGPGGASFTLSF